MAIDNRYVQVFPTETKGDTWSSIVCLDGDAGTAHQLSALVATQDASDYFERLSGRPIRTVNELQFRARATSTVTVIMGKDNNC